VIVETVRIIADWMADATYGVNAVRDAVPRDTGVRVAPAVAVLDSTRDGRVTRGGVPQGITGPALLVSPADQPLEQANPAVRPFPPDASLTVLVRFVTANLDSAEAERDASQTIKAVWWQVPQLLLTSAGEAARTRAGVQLYAISNMQAVTLYESDADTIVTGGVLIACRVRYLGPS
jgi:hypothetical protein